jgi:hypothetical protein
MTRTIIHILGLTAAVAAAALLAGAARAAPPARSQTFGGDGGASFDDSGVNDGWGRITKIVVRHGDGVDSIGLAYANGNYLNHGGTGGTESNINLKPDEYIVGVEGRSGDRLDQITFVSNMKRYGPYGGKGGSPFSVSFKGQVLRFLFGRSGTRIDRIGFTYGDRPKSPPSTITRSNAHGGTGGDPFDDLSAGGLSAGKIQSITVWSGDRIDKIQVTYKDGTQFTHGGGGGQQNDTFTLADDEWLVEIQGRSGDNIDQLLFITNKPPHQSPAYGGKGGKPFTLKKKAAKPGEPDPVIRAFFGRSKDRIDQFGVYFEEKKIAKIDILKITYHTNKFLIQTSPPVALMSASLVNETSADQTVQQGVSFAKTDSVTTTIAETNELNTSFTVEANFFLSKESVTVGYKKGPPQQNSWANCGSGRAPRR